MVQRCKDGHGTGKTRCAVRQCTDEAAIEVQDCRVELHVRVELNATIATQSREVEVTQRRPCHYVT